MQLRDGRAWCHVQSSSLLLSGRQKSREAISQGKDLCVPSSPRAGGGAASAEERPSNGHSTPQPRSMTAHTSAANNTPIHACTLCSKRCPQHHQPPGHTKP